MRMVADIRADHESEWGAITRVSGLLGVGSAETVRKWVRQDQVDSGTRAGTSTQESAEVRRLRRENAELRRANGILKAAAAFFEGPPARDIGGTILGTRLPRGVGA